MKSDGFVPIFIRLTQPQRVSYEEQDPKVLIENLKQMDLRERELNPELFKADITDTLIEKGMIKTIGILESRMRLDKGPNMVEELIRRDNAMLKYIAETGIANKLGASANTPRADEANL